jgi:hypothetical protein
MDSDKIILAARRLVVRPDVMEGDTAVMWTALDNSRTAPVFQPLIRAEIDLLLAPEVPVVSKADARRLANIKHDKYGRATRHYCMGVLEDPDASPEAKEAAATVLTTFVPSAAEFSLDTASEVANAHRREPLLDTHAGALALVPAAGGRNARDVLVGMYRTADEREDLAGEQGATSSPPAKDGTRWARLWGLLNEFRTMLAREAQTNAQLPKNMDQLCFGPLDQL